MILIEQTYQNRKVVVSVVGGENNYTYACYIYNNKECIRKIMYSNNSIFSIDVEEMKGNIIFQIFLKEKITNKIENYFLSPISILREKEEINSIKLNNCHEVDYDKDVVVNGIDIPILLKRKNDSDKLFIFFNGAVTIATQKKYYPYFSRVSWSDKFNGHCLYIYDKSLDMAEDYTLGWYRGGEISLHDIYLELIKKFSEKLNVKYENIYFYGSSGGGFAALKFSESFPLSTAIAINPQIKCLNYGLKAAVDKFKSVYHNHNNSSSVEVNPDKFYKNGSKMILVQNIQDVPHYENHFKPFWSHFAKTSQPVDYDNWNQAILYDHESGHGGEPKEVLDEILKLIN